jgi:hypothetical protein
MAQSPGRFVNAVRNSAKALIIAGGHLLAIKRYDAKRVIGKAVQVLSEPVASSAKSRGEEMSTEKVLEMIGYDGDDKRQEKKT